MLHKELVLSSFLYHFLDLSKKRNISKRVSMLRSWERKCRSSSFGTSRIIQGNFLIDGMIFYRLNINNFNYIKLKVKRDRALNYWKSRVIQNFLPPIDPIKKQEINERILKLKK